MKPSQLTPDRGLIFRITHVDNIRWLLQNGVHCRNSAKRDPKFRRIGNEELIEKRALRKIPVEPGGTLSDYVPFYFTPWSPMLLNITTGYRGTPMTPSEEIAVLVVKVAALADERLPFLVTDRHAYLATAEFHGGLRGLERLDWPLLQSRDFQRSDEDPGKFDRYQAEALVHRLVPASSLAGIVVYNNARRDRVSEELRGLDLDVKLLADQTFYFS